MSIDGKELDIDQELLNEVVKAEGVGIDDDVLDELVGEAKQPEPLTEEQLKDRGFFKNLSESFQQNAFAMNAGVGEFVGNTIGLVEKAVQAPLNGLGGNLNILMSQEYNTLKTPVGDFFKRIAEDGRNRAAQHQAAGLGAEVGGVLPQTLEIGATMLASAYTGGGAGVLGAASRANAASLPWRMGAGAAGQVQHDYKEYKESQGESVSDLEMLNAGLIGGGLEVVTEKMGLDRLTGRGGKWLSKALFRQFGEMSNDILAEVKRRNPSLALKSLKGVSDFAENAVSEVTEEEITEVGNILHEAMYKWGNEEAQDELMNSIGARMTGALNGAVMMSGFLHPIQRGLVRKEDSDRRKAEGVRLVRNATGGVFEVVEDKGGQLVVKDVNGIEGEVNQTDIESEKRFTAQEYKTLLKAKKDSQQYEQQANAHRMKNDQTGMVETSIYKNEDGSIDGMFIHSRDEATGMAAVTDSEGRRKLIPITDLNGRTNANMSVEQYIGFQSPQAIDELNEPIHPFNVGDTVAGAGFVGVVTDQLADGTMTIQTPDGQSMTANATELKAAKQFGDQVGIKGENGWAIGEPMPDLEEAEKAAQKMSVNYPGLVLHVDDIPGVDATSATTYQIRATEREAAQTAPVNTPITPKEPVDEVATATAPEVAREEPRMNFNGKAIPKALAKVRIGKANSRDELQGLDTNDPELLQMVESKFPATIPAYRFAGEDISREDAMNIIEAMDETESAELEIEHDPEVIQLRDMKFAQPLEIDPEVAVELLAAPEATPQGSELPAGQVIENKMVTGQIEREGAKTEANPTEAQKEAGNYKKGHVKLHGMDISIKQAKGSVRSGIDEDGKVWESEMKNPYGYIRGTEGSDGDNVDVFIGENPTGEQVFVVNQVNPKMGKFDEHKVMIGFNSQSEAETAYLSNYEAGWNGMSSVVPMTMAEFKKWAYDKNKTKKPVAAPKSKKPKGKPGLSQNRKKALALEVFTEYDMVLQYFIGGGKLNKQGLFKFFGTKGKENDPDVRRRVESERRPRFTWVGVGGLTDEMIAHSLWQDTQTEVLEMDIDAFRDAVGSIVLSFVSPEQMAKDLLRRHSIQEQQYTDEQIAELEAMEREEEHELERQILEWAMAEYEIYSALSDEELVELFYPEYFSKESNNNDNLDTPNLNQENGTTEENQRGTFTGFEAARDRHNEDNGQEQAGSIGTDAHRIDGSQKADRPTGVEGLSAERERTERELRQAKERKAAAERKYYILKAKLNNDPDHGMRGQADIFGNVAGSDNLFGAQLDGGAGAVVRQAKAEFDNAAQEYVALEEKLRKIDDALFNAAHGQGELFGSDAQNSPSNPVQSEKQESADEVQGVVDQIYPVEKFDNSENNNSFTKNKISNEVSKQSPSSELGGSTEIHSRQEDALNRCIERIAEAQRDAPEGASNQEINHIAEAFAKENNLWYSLSEIDELGTPFIGGNENTTYLNENDGYIYKMNNLMNDRGSIQAFLARIKLHNQLFPETAYEFVGFSGFTGRSIYPIFKQKYIDNTVFATEADIANYMQSIGFKPTGGMAEWANSDYVLNDLHPRNVLKDTKGTIYVVDAGIEKAKETLDQKGQEVKQSVIDEINDRFGIEQENKTEQSQKSGVERIEDFGERIEGAKKMLHERLSEVTEEAIKHEPLSNAATTDPNAKFQIIGEKGAANLDKAEEATIRLDNLRVAKEMENVGNIDGLKSIVLNLFQKAAQGDITGKPITIGNIIDDGREYLSELSGTTMKDFVSFVVNPSDLRHIYNEHYGSNEKDKGQNHPLSDEDIKQMVDVIIKPERIVSFKENGVSKFIFLAESPQGGAYNLVEVYGDKRGNLTAKSLYNTKKDVSHRAMTVIEQSKLSTSKTSRAILSTTKIPSLFDYTKQFTPTEIRLATGWERGADGRWRYEVPDGDFKEGWEDAETLLQAWDDETLFTAFPQLKEVQIGSLVVDENEEQGGVFHPKQIDDKPTIHAIAPTKNELKSALLHEIQHAIQAIEGFARGGNPDDFPTEELFQKAKELNLLGKGFTDNQIRFKAYQALAGETEARNVQTRMNMTEAERREVLLSETEDVSREDQIFLANSLWQSLDKAAEGSGKNYTLEQQKQWENETAQRVHEGKAQTQPATQTQIQWGTEAVQNSRVPESDLRNHPSVQWQDIHHEDNNRGVTYLDRELTNMGKLKFMGDKITGTAKIKSTNDIAFLFKNLESAASENAFAVHVKADGTYRVQYLSTGGTTSAVIDIKMIVAAAKEFEAERVYMVHNHPAGSLMPSKADIEVTQKLQAAAQSMGIKAMDGVIIDTDKGLYSVIDTESETGDVEEKAPVKGEVSEVDVYQFDRQKLYVNSHERERLTDSHDVAVFLSKQKRGMTNKIHAIIVDPSLHVNKYVLFDETTTIKELTKELMGLVGKHGEKVFLASNGVFDAKTVRELNRNLGHINSQVLDVLVVRQDSDIVNHYKSMADEGLFKKGAKAKGMHVDVVRTMVRGFAAKISHGSKVVVVQSQSELPEQMQGERKAIPKQVGSESAPIQGFYSPDADTVYLVADNLSEDIVFKTYVHEQLLHKGIDMLIPDKAHQQILFKQVFDTIGEKAIRAKIGEEYDSAPDHVKALEYLAHTAEDILEEKDLTPKQRSAWDGFVEAITGFVRKMFGRNINFTIQELHAIIRASAQEVIGYVDTEGTGVLGEIEEDAFIGSDGERGGHDGSLLANGGDGRQLDKEERPDGRRGGRGVGNRTQSMQDLLFEVLEQSINILPLHHATASDFDYFDDDYFGGATNDKVHGEGHYFGDVANHISRYGGKAALAAKLYDSYLAQMNREVGQDAVKWFEKAVTRNGTMEGLLRREEPELSAAIAEFMQRNPMPKVRLMLDVKAFKHKSDGKFNLLDWETLVPEHQKTALLQAAQTLKPEHRERVEALFTEPILGKNLAKELFGRKAEPGIMTETEVREWMQRAGINGVIADKRREGNKEKEKGSYVVVFDRDQVAIEQKGYFKKGTPQGAEQKKRETPLFERIRNRATTTHEILAGRTTQAKQKEQWIEREAKRAAERFNTPVKVVGKHSELPTHLRGEADAMGVYDPTTDTIFVVADNVSNPMELVATITHEAIGHRGVLKVLGGRAREAYQGIYDSMSEVDRNDFAKLYDLDLSNEHDRLTCAEEYVAYMSEQAEIPKAIDLFVSKVRDLIRTVFGIEYSRADILALITRASENYRYEAKPRVEQYEAPAQYLEALGTWNNARYRKANRPASDLTTLGDDSRGTIQDRMLQVKRLEQEVERRGGSVKEFSKAYRQENLSYGRVSGEMTRIQKTLAMPLLEEVGKLVKKGASLEAIQRYMKAKHAIERNIDLTEKKAAARREKDIRKAGEAAQKRGDEMDKELIAGFITLKEHQARINASKQAQVSDEKAAQKRYEKGILTPEKHSGIAQDDAIEIVKDFEADHDTKALWKAKKQLSDYVLDRWLQDGFIDAQQHEYQKNRYEYYVPLRGFAEEDNTWEYQNKQMGKVINPNKIAHGRKSESEDPLQYMVNMAHSAIVLGEKNRIKQHIYRLAGDNKEMTDLFKIQKVWHVLLPGSTEVIETYEKPDEETFNAGLVVDVDTQKNPYRIGKSSRELSEHEILVFINGRRHVVYMDNPNVAHAINKTNIEEMPQVMRYTSAATRWLIANFTAKNPAFIPINSIRDVAYTFLSHAIQGHSSPEYIKSLMKARRMIRAHQKGKPGTKQYEDFIRMGGQTGLIHMRDVDKIKADIEKEVKRLSGTNSTWDKVSHARALKYSGEMLENWAVRSEDLCRFATYMMAIDAGKTPAEAAFEAKEISVNFNRKGSHTNLVGGLYAFFNASLQGIENFSRLGWKHKGKFLAAGAGFTAMGFIVTLLQALNDDEDEKKNAWAHISPYVKRNYLVVTYGQEDYFSIPLPHGFKAFYALGVIAAEAMVNGANKMSLAADIADIISSSFSPIDLGGFVKEDKMGRTEPSLRPLIPTIAVPFYDLATNEDFAGRKVSKEAYFNEEILSEAGLYRKNVNPLIKGLTDMAYVLGGGDTRYYTQFKTGNGVLEPIPWMAQWNPSKIEHLISYYTGGRGVFFNQTLKTSMSILEGATGVIKGKDNAWDNFDASDVPVFSRLHREGYGKNVMRDYYILKDEVDAFKKIEALKPEWERSYSPDMELKKELVSELEKVMKDMNEDVKETPEMAAQINDIKQRVMTSYTKGYDIK